MLILQIIALILLVVIAVASVVTAVYMYRLWHVVQMKVSMKPAYGPYGPVR